MKYIDIYKQLKDLENFEDDEIIIDDNLMFRNFSFESNYQTILPGGIDNADNYEFASTSEDLKSEPDLIQDLLNTTDADILENIKFRYHTITPRNEEKSKGIILMFHGFNEKNWRKYLPWAKYLVETTGKTVVLFPMAFHMNRAPSIWSNKREMYSIARKRAQRHPNIIKSSLSNVAISTRLHNKPQRFIWSGLQAYYDVIDFIQNIKMGGHPLISPDASIDIFSYSIGSFMSEVLMMTNQNGYFSNSKLVCFCGGAVFNRLSPVSKFILDSEANVSLYSFVVEHLESHLKRDKTLNQYLGGSLPEGMNFRSMLDYKVFMPDREAKFRAMSDRVYAVTLLKDTVVPPYEVINTLQGIRRDIPIKVEIEDMSYKYTHEDPFPPKDELRDEVDREFKRIFKPIGEFLK